MRINLVAPSFRRKMPKEAAGRCEKPKIHKRSTVEVFPSNILVLLLHLVKILLFFCYETEKMSSLKRSRVGKGQDGRCDSGVLAGDGEIARMTVRASGREAGLIRQYTKMSGTAMSRFICLPLRTGSGTRAPGPSFRSTWRRPGGVISFPMGRRTKAGSPNDRRADPRGRISGRGRRYTSRSSARMRASSSSTGPVYRFPW